MQTLVNSIVYAPTMLLVNTKVRNALVGATRLMYVLERSTVMDTHG
jgi:hypothetical protein